MLHVRQGKGGKDRVLPLGTMLCRGIKEYLQAEGPRRFLFEGHNGEAFSQCGAQWVMSQAVKKPILSKKMYRCIRCDILMLTHLLEQGVDILTIKELLGHAHIDTTMIYVHLARPMLMTAFSPLDTLYKKG